MTQAEAFEQALERATKIEEGDNTAHELSFTFDDGSTTKVQFDALKGYVDAFGESRW